MKKLINLLNRPYPESKDYKSHVKGLLLIGAFIGIFLYIFRPFNLHLAEQSLVLMCLGFGAITFVVSILYDFLLRILFKIKTVGSSYTFGKWLFSTMGLILVIGITNFFFLGYFLGINISGLWNMIFSTFLVGLFPLIFLGSYVVRTGEDKYGAIAKDLNQKISNKSSETIDVLGISSDSIRYIEAMQNYIRIWYVDEQLTNKTERTTIASIEAILGQSDLRRCHRSYIVNRSAITNVSGNAQGLQLTIKDSDTIVPVSRKYVDAFR